jgi:hypothetical protein
VTACLHQFDASAAAPAALNISKVAVGCASLETLKKRQQLRVVDGEVQMVTRFMPKRAAELIGGSVYWIVKHQLVARQSILGFAEREEDRRTIVRLGAALIPVRPFPKRAHQGWRYLSAADAPADLSDASAGETLPAELMRKLMALALL